jgi:hypothetical protein
VTEDGRSASVPLLQQEMYLLRNLLGLSIPVVTGWSYQLNPSSFDPAVNLLAASKGSAGSS